MRQVNFQSTRVFFWLAVGALALMIASQIYTPSFQVHWQTNSALRQAVTTLFAPGSLDEVRLETARARLIQVMDTSADPYTMLRRLREIEAARWYVQSQKLKEQGSEWETVFSYQEWTRQQFERTILDLWQASDPPDWYNLGKAAARMQLWDLAAYFYGRATANGASDEPLLRLNYAHALLQSDQPAEAEAQLAGIELADPAQQARANWFLAQSLAAQSRDAEAAALVETVAAAAPALLSTGEGARMARQIEAHVPMSVTAGLRTQWARQEANLLTNGGFEQGQVGWGMWPEPGASSTLDDERVYSGLQSFRVQFDGTEDVNFYQVAQKVAVQPGQEYQLSAQMWADTLLGDAAIDVRAQDWFGGFTYPIMHGSTEGWQTVTHTFTVPAGITEVSVTIVRYGGNGVVSGTVWADDIVLEPASVQ